MMLVLGGCGDGDRASKGSKKGEGGFPEIGSLSDPSGKDSFRFGAASAATQIEDQNPNTDWYVFTQPESEGGLGKGTAPVGEAARGFSKALEDVALLEELNLDSYRFSIEWARIEPERDRIDESALQHYSDFIDALIAAGIRPNVTLHHFSNPLWIDDPRDIECAAGPTDTNLCGLGHPEGGQLVVEEMAEHARLVAERFGDRVDEWGTLNEPVNYLLAAHGLAIFPPGKQKLFSLLDEFIPVVRDYLDAHAAMYAAVKAADTADADGDGEAASVGLTLNVAEWIPAQNNAVSDDPVDVAARDRLVYVYHYLTPDSLRDGTFDADLDGSPDEDHPQWAGTLDWLGIQFYMRAGVTGSGGLVPVLELTPCFGDFDFGSCVPPTDPSFCVPEMRYEFHAPGLYDVLTDFGERYPDQPMVVTEARPGDDRGSAARRERREDPRADRARPRRRHRRARLLPLEPLRQLRVGRGIRAALRALPRRLRHVRAVSDPRRQRARRDRRRSPHHRGAPEDVRRQRADDRRSGARERVLQRRSLRRAVQREAGASSLDGGSRSPVAGARVLPTRVPAAK